MRTCAEGARALPPPQAANMLEHEEEIMARPARTWFQTERQKKEVARRAKDAAENGGLAGRGMACQAAREQKGAAPKPTCNC